MSPVGRWPNTATRSASPARRSADERSRSLPWDRLYRATWLLAGPPSRLLASVNQNRNHLVLPNGNQRNVELRCYRHRGAVRRMNGIGNRPVRSHLLHVRKLRNPELRELARRQMPNVHNRLIGSPLRFPWCPPSLVVHFHLPLCAPTPFLP